MLRRTVTNHDPYNYVRQFSPPLEKSCIRPCLQPLMLIFWCIWRENTRAGQVAAGWIDGACGPDIMLKFKGCRGPDRQSSRAGFGPRAGLCRPLHYSITLWACLSQVHRTHTFHMQLPQAVDEVLTNSCKIHTRATLLSSGTNHKNLEHVVKNREHMRRIYNTSLQPGRPWAYVHPGRS